MIDIIIEPQYSLPLSFVFFFIAFIYSSVGLSGGSAYTALMAILGFDILTIPMITLSLNFFVSLVGSFNFLRNKNIKIKFVFPFLITSVPMAYFGGSLKVSNELFYWILLISLIVVALRMYCMENIAFKLNLSSFQKKIISLCAGALLGLISGIVGIGGGIYLVPLIIILGLGNEKEAAACGSVFILLNSISGLISRFQYNSIDLTNYIPIIIAVLLGGFAGSFMGSFKFSVKAITKILGIVILIAIFFLIKKITGL